MLLQIKAVPKSSHNHISWYDKENKILKINIKAPAEEGKANQMLLEILADFFQLKKNQIYLKIGGKTRYKIVEIEADEKIILSKLETIL